MLRRILVAVAIGAALAIVMTIPAGLSAVTEHGAFAFGMVRIPPDTTAFHSIGVTARRGDTARVVVDMCPSWTVFAKGAGNASS